MKRLLYIVLVTVASSSYVYADNGKDPRTRDEDISDTTVSVTHRRNAIGGYEYEYLVSSSTNNKGRILAFTVDVSCKGVQATDRLQPQRISGGSLGSRSQDGEHVATTVRADFGQAALFGVSRNNEAKWAVSLDPGETATGLRLTSPYPPSNRRYHLVPSMDNDRSWNYPEVPDPSIPWIDDFTVTGIIAGPACPGSKRLSETGVFAGSDEAPREAEGTNSLLTYKGIDRNRLHTTANAMEIEVHYSLDVDPQTFQIEPASLRPLFQPKPGSMELIEIPLQGAKTKVRLSISSGETAPGDSSEASRIDVDHFEFRHRQKGEK